MRPRHAYLDDRLDDLFNLPRLDQPLGLRTEGRELGLVRGDAPLEERNVVLVEPLPAVKQVAQADQGVPLALEILQHPRVPGARLVLHEALRRSEMLAHGLQAIVQQRNIVGVGGIRVGADIGERCQSHGDASMVGCHPLRSLDETIHNVAEADVQLSAAVDAQPGSAEQILQRQRQRILQASEQGTAGKLILHGYRGLFAPNRQLLDIRQSWFDQRQANRGLPWARSKT